MNRPTPTDNLIRGSLVRYQGRIASVARVLPGGRLDLEIRSDPSTMPEKHAAVHKGPGGWSPLPEAPSQPPSP
jgi:hypothetical protein